MQYYEIAIRRFQINSITSVNSRDYSSFHPFEVELFEGGVLFQVVSKRGNSVLSPLWEMCAVVLTETAAKPKDFFCKPSMYWSPRGASLHRWSSKA